MERITPDQITELKDNEVFVFGSNLADVHDNGTAKQALSWGAEYGEGFGLQGKTFAIPTKDSSLETLPLSDIHSFVTVFLFFAKRKPYLTFLVTEIGCGLAGYKPEQIAPLFEKAAEIKNIYLPVRFWNELKYYA